MAETLYDVAVVGAGPTGLAAAVYTTREDLKTIVVDKGVVGGLIATTETVDNYPGFPDGVGGIELAERMQKQAERFGAEIKLNTEVVGLSPADDHVELKLVDGVIKARSVLIATGSAYRKLQIPGEKELEGRGVHYCATCDGPLYRNKDLVVVGGGNTALQESLFLAKFARKITMLVRKSEFRGSEILVEAIQQKDNIEVKFEAEATEVVASQGRFDHVAVATKGQTESLKADGLFVFIGLLPNTDWLHKAVSLDERNLVEVDKQMRTNIAAVFAAGDVTEGSIGQVASAVGEGVSAALAIRAYLDPHHGTTGY